MGTVAYRAALVREIRQAMERIHPHPGGSRNYQDGQLDAYAHILTLVDDMEDQ
jgi:hypothetical protein